MILKQELLVWQPNLLCIVRELAGGGSVAVVFYVGERLQGKFFFFSFFVLLRIFAQVKIFTVFCRQDFNIRALQFFSNK